MCGWGIQNEKAQVRNISIIVDILLDSIASESESGKKYIFITHIAASLMNTFNGTWGIYLPLVFLKGKIIGYFFLQYFLFTNYKVFSYLILFNAIVVQSRVGNDGTSKVTKFLGGRGAWPQSYKQ